MVGASVVLRLAGLAQGARPAGECPRISPEFLREERLSLGDAMYAQEYETEFIDDTFDVFNLTLFENMLIDEPAWNL